MYLREARLDKAAPRSAACAIATSILVPPCLRAEMIAAEDDALARQAGPGADIATKPMKSSAFIRCSRRLVDLVARRLDQQRLLMPPREQRDARSSGATNTDGSATAAPERLRSMSLRLARIQTTLSRAPASREKARRTMTGNCRRNTAWI